MMADKKTKEKQKKSEVKKLFPADLGMLKASKNKPLKLNLAKRSQRKYLTGGALAAVMLLGVYAGGGTLFATLFQDVGFGVFDAFDQGDGVVQSVSETGVVTEEKALKDIEMHVMGPKDAVFFGYDENQFQFHPASEREPGFQFQNYREFDIELAVLGNRWKPEAGAMVLVNGLDGKPLFKGITNDDGYFSIENISLPIHHSELEARVALETEEVVLVGSAKFPVKMHLKGMSLVLRVFPNKALK